MTIISAEMKYYKAANNFDGGGNGGYMSANQLVTAIKNNLWPDLTQAERDAGLTRYRKVFCKVENDADETLANAEVHLINITPAQDRITMFAGTQSDIQSGIGSPREYGAGSLNADITAGQSQLVVNIEVAEDLIQDGDKIYITDGSNEEYHDNVDCTRVGSQITIDLDSGDTFVHSYAAATPTYCAAVYEYGDLEGTSDNWVETTTSGTYDETTYPIEVDWIGGIEESWTITFSDASNFSCSGSRVGSVGSGTIGSDFQPTNTDFTKPYFTLRSAGWGGTWANGETVTFDTHPCSIPIWMKLVCPAGTSSYSANNIKLKFNGESA